MKKYRILLVGLFVITFPLLINVIIVQKTPLWVSSIAGDESDWLMFWATYIGASATAIMAWLTYNMFKQNKFLLDSQQQRWEAERRGILSISISTYKNIYCLEVKNIGLSRISNLNMIINSDFIDLLRVEDLKKSLESLERKNIILNPNEYKQFLIFFCASSSKRASFKIYNTKLENSEVNEILSDILNHKITITGTYVTLGKVYDIVEAFTMDDFLVNSIVTDNEFLEKLDNINNSLSNINETLTKSTF